jgi:hypothetical protein
MAVYTDGLVPPLTESGQDGVLPFRGNWPVARGMRRSRRTNAAVRSNLSDAGPHCAEVTAGPERWELGWDVNQLLRLRPRGAEVHAPDTDRVRSGNRRDGGHRPWGERDRSGKRVIAGHAGHRRQHDSECSIAGSYGSHLHAWQRVSFAQRPDNLQPEPECRARADRFIRLLGGPHASRRGCAPHLQRVKRTRSEPNA